ncbi:putative alcohol oxidase [Lyophyllum shimeji]|uniref:Alcohol oxidase n=1 Tax=Lyophyllum shimeji TaxID=47721 RepID=A0A9P3PRM7_LYOSH|nr:putative alcohol oxidase [Lyophyllum shimeji]
MTNDDSAAAKKWGWDQFYIAMKKSETFTPPRDEVAEIGNITWSASTHGTQGPMDASYPAIMMSQVGEWASGLDALGLPALKEPNGGKTLGSLVGPSWINPSNWTRSYSKSAYLDPALSRANLAVLVNSTATRIIFTNGSDDLTATAVEFASSRDGPRKTVSVAKEVIISAGVVGSPQLLMLSGVGPKDALEAAGVPSRVDLPGVGQHVQDHLTAAVVWNSTAETAGDIQRAGSDFAKLNEFLSFVNSATAFANLTRLFGPEGAAAFQKAVVEGLTDSAGTLVPSTSPEVVQGYKIIYSTIANKIFTTDVAVIELLLALNSPGEVGVQAAMQHPLSQGRLYINSSSAFDPPIIDPQYFSHWADLTIMREGIKLVRTLKDTKPFNSSLGNETVPGPSVVTDEDLDAWIINQASTQYHPIASCAMLPRSQGGVVNAKLQVYGLGNVRVVDSSVFPFEFAAHVGASTYGLAEQASGIILADNKLRSDAVKVSVAGGYMGNPLDDIYPPL